MAKSRTVGLKLPGLSPKDAQAMELSFGEGTEWAVYVEQDEEDGRFWYVSSYGNWFGEPLLYAKRDDAERALLLIAADMRQHGASALDGFMRYRALCEAAGLREAWKQHRARNG